MGLLDLFWKVQTIEELLTKINSYTTKEKTTWSVTSSSKQTNLQWRLHQWLYEFGVKVGGNMESQN